MPAPLWRFGIRDRIIGSPFPVHSLMNPMPSSLSQFACAVALFIAALTTETSDTRPESSRSLADTASVHKRLRGAINDFQDKWRGKWESGEMGRHGMIKLIDIRGTGGVPGDREMGNLTPDLRRYLSILCFVDTPSEPEIGAAIQAAFSGKKLPVAQGKRPRATGIQMDGISWATPRLIVPRPNTGSLCPAWLPPDENIPPDEGEAIDLALPIKERAALRLERAKLLGILDAAQKENPDDSWITGQRVRFAFDQQDNRLLDAAANDCRTNDSWCLALKGFALQRSDDLLATERIFRQAEEAAPAAALTDSLCGNRETLLLLNHDDRDEIVKKSCAEQRTIMNTMWWFADPLWAVPGNERYIAHQVRKVHATLRSVTDRDERYYWADYAGGKAMRELVIRYGWPSYTYWPGRQLDEEINKYRDFGEGQHFYSAYPYTAKEYSPDRTALIPNGKALFNPLDVSADAWRLYAPTKTIDDWWPQEHSVYATHLSTLHAGQDVLWRRDTSVTYQLAIDDPLRDQPATTKLSNAILMGGDGPATTRKLAQAPIGPGFTLRWTTSLPSSPLVMSAEILPTTIGQSALRRRYAVRPPATLREMKIGEVALSEPVFMRMPNRTMAVPVDQASVQRYMAGALTFMRDEPIAVYWESYGFALGDTLNVELKFRRDDDLNIAQRILGSVGVGGDRDSVSIKWTEPDPRHASVIVSASKPVVGRSVAVDFTALEDGAYMVSLEMRKGKTISARSERRIFIRKR